MKYRGMRSLLGMLLLHDNKGPGFFSNSGFHYILVLIKRGNGLGKVGFFHLIHFSKTYMPFPIGQSSVTWL